MEATTTTNTKGGTKYLVELALMIAIIFVMAFTPLGYLRTPGLSITFLTVPVAVAAMILGPKGGAICGAAFGITSLMQCFGTIWGNASWNQSIRYRIYMYRSKNPGRSAQRSDLQSSQKQEQESGVFCRRTGLSGSEYHFLHELSGVILL